MKKLLCFLIFVLLISVSILKSQTLTDKNTIKSWFLTGLRPTQTQFHTLIDNSYNAVTSGLLNATGYPAISFQPWSSAGAGRLYTGTSNPTGTIRLNYDGYFYATKIYAGGIEINGQTIPTTNNPINIYTSGLQNGDFLSYNTLTSRFENYSLENTRNIFFPAQGGANVGKVLKTNGTSVYWDIDLNDWLNDSVNYYTRSFTNKLINDTSLSIRDWVSQNYSFPYTKTLVGNLSWERGDNEFYLGDGYSYLTSKSTNEYPLGIRLYGNLNTIGFTVDNRTTTLNSSGLRYEGNYTSENVGNSLWIPHKGYVDSSILKQVADTALVLRGLIGGGSGTLDSAKLITKYDLANGIDQSFILTTTWGQITHGIASTISGFGIYSQNLYNDISSQSAWYPGRAYIFHSGYKPGRVFEISTDTSGISFKNDGVIVAKIDSSGYFSQQWGSDVTAASTITPTGPMFRIIANSPTTINTINLPFPEFSGEIKIVAYNNSNVTLGTSGNIVMTTTLTSNTLYTLLYDVTQNKWFVSGGSSTGGFTGSYTSPGGTGELTVDDNHTVLMNNGSKPEIRTYVQTDGSNNQTTIVSSGVNVSTILSVDSSKFEISGFISQPWGQDIASASTITADHYKIKITGTVTINTIIPPYPSFEGEIKVVVVDGADFGSSGNIIKAVTAAPNDMYFLFYDPSISKWYIK